MRIKIDSIEDAEGLFADLRAYTGGAPEHLLVENTAVDAADENEILDARHVNASRQKIDRDRDFGRASLRNDRIRSPDDRRCQ